MTFVRLKHTLASVASITIVLSPIWSHAQVSETPALPKESSSVKSRPLGEQRDRLPAQFADGSDLPNGWRITPAGKAIGTFGDLC
jgi:hypothetical protein